MAPAATPPRVSRRGAQEKKKQDQEKKKQETEKKKQETEKKKQEGEKRKQEVDKKKQEIQELRERTSVRNWNTMIDKQLLKQIQKSVKHEEWRLKMRVLVNHLFHRVRGWDREDTKCIINACMPSNPNIIGGIGAECEYVESLVRELAVIIANVHEALVRAWLVDYDGGKRYVKAYAAANRGHRRIPLADPEEILKDLGLNDDASVVTLWWTLHLSVSDNVWTREGQATVGRDHYLNLHRATLRLLGRLAYRLAPLEPEKRQLDLEYILKEVRDTGDTKNPPTLPPLATLPRTTQHWLTFPDKYRTARDNPSVEHIFLYLKNGHEWYKLVDRASSDKSRTRNDDKNTNDNNERDNAPQDNAPPPNEETRQPDRTPAEDDSTWADGVPESPQSHFSDGMSDASEERWSRFRSRSPTPNNPQLSQAPRSPASPIDVPPPASPAPRSDCVSAVNAYYKLRNIPMETAAPTKSLAEALPLPAAQTTLSLADAVYCEPIDLEEMHSDLISLEDEFSKSRSQAVALILGPLSPDDNVTENAARIAELGPLAMLLFAMEKGRKRQAGLVQAIGCIHKELTCLQALQVEMEQIFEGIMKAENVHADLVARKGDELGRLAEKRREAVEAARNVPAGNPTSLYEAMQAMNSVPQAIHSMYTGMVPHMAHPGMHPPPHPGMHAPSHHGIAPHAHHPGMHPPPQGYPWAPNAYYAPPYDPRTYYGNMYAQGNAPEPPAQPPAPIYGNPQYAPAPIPRPSTNNADSSRPSSAAPGSPRSYNSRPVGVPTPGSPNPYHRPSGPPAGGAPSAGAPPPAGSRSPYNRSAAFQTQEVAGPTPKKRRIDECLLSDKCPTDDATEPPSTGPTSEPPVGMTAEEYEQKMLSSM